MSNHYRTITPNGHGGGTTYPAHVVNPVSREEAYAVASRTPGAYVEVSPNGVIGWVEDAPDTVVHVDRSTEGGNAGRGRSATGSTAQPHMFEFAVNEALTQVTDLTPGDVITLDLHRATRITVRSVAPYGDAETILTDLDGAIYILANTNWF